MYGAILGDMISSPYEFDKSPKKKEFPLFIPRSRYTDDSAMTIAVAEVLLDTLGKSRQERKKAVVRSMQKWGRRYPDAGHGEGCGPVLRVSGRQKKVNNPLIFHSF